MRLVLTRRLGNTLHRLITLMSSQFQHIAPYAGSHIRLTDARLIPPLLDRSTLMLLLTPFKLYPTDPAPARIEILGLVVSEPDPDPDLHPFVPA